MSARPKLKPQHAPKAPHEDAQFLESTPARPLRILAEYLHPLVQLKREGIGDTIVMFGSARIGSREAAEAKLERLKKVKMTKVHAADRAAHREALRLAKALWKCHATTKKRDSFPTRLPRGPVRWDRGRGAL